MDSYFFSARVTEGILHSFPISYSFVVVVVYGFMAFALVISHAILLKKVKK